MNESLIPDGNTRQITGFVTDDSNQFIRRARIDDATKGLKVMIVGGVGAGTVTEIDTSGSVTGGPITTTGTISLVNDSTTPGNSFYYGTNSSGTKGFFALPASGTGTVTSVTSANANATVATTTTTPVITIVSAPKLQTARTIGGTSFDGTANIAIGALTSTNVGATTSAQFAAVISDETGTGKLVFGTKPTFIGTIQTRTAMAAQALDGSTGNMFTRTLAGNETFTQSNFSTGQNFIVEVINEAGGGDTVTWFAGITWVTTGGTAPVQASGASGRTTYGFTCTGSNTFLGYLVGTN